MADCEIWTVPIRLLIEIDPVSDCEPEDDVLEDVDEDEEPLDDGGEYESESCPVEGPDEPLPLSDGGEVVSVSWPVEGPDDEPEDEPEPTVTGATLSGPMTVLDTDSPE